MAVTQHQNNNNKKNPLVTPPLNRIIKYPGKGTKTKDWGREITKK